MQVKKSDKQVIGKTEQICIVLRSAIIENVIVAGSRLPEDAIGEQFGVSRTLAKQALEKLASEGLVEIRPNKGAVVATPSWQDARDIIDLRIVIEDLIVRRLCGHLTPEQIQRLKDHIALEEAAKSHIEPRSIRLATDFHVLLGEMANSPILLKFLREIVYRCGLTLAMYSRPHSSECGVTEHLELVDALVAADEKKATKLMTRHLENIAQRAQIKPSSSPKALAEAIAHYRDTLAQ